MGCTDFIQVRKGQGKGQINLGEVFFHCIDFIAGIPRRGLDPVKDVLIILFVHDTDFLIF